VVGGSEVECDDDNVSVLYLALVDKVAFGIYLERSRQGMVG